MLFQKKQNPYQTNSPASATNKKNTLIGLSIVTVLLIIITTILSTSNKQPSAEESASLYYKYENSKFSINVPKNFVATSNLANKITFQTRDGQSKNNPEQTTDLPTAGQFSVLKYIKSNSLKEPIIERIKRLNTNDLEGNELPGLSVQEKQINNEPALVVEADKSKTIFIIKTDYVWMFEFSDDTEGSLLLKQAETISASLAVK